MMQDFESDDLCALKIPDEVNHVGQVVSTHVEV
jgi:hypothetical protein